MNLVPNVFPDPPTGYIEIKKIKSSKTWIAPEDGGLRFIGLAASGKGGYGVYGQWGTTHFAGGGGGGAGGIVVSDFPLKKGNAVNLSINGNIKITNDITGKIATAEQGGSGANGVSKDAYQGVYGGKGGKGGTADGGNFVNQSGSEGGAGGTTTSTSNIPESRLWGSGAVNRYSGYSTTGGVGNGSVGSQAYIVVLRGNTNLNLSQINTLDITSLMLENNQIEQKFTQIMLNSAQ